MTDTKRLSLHGRLRMAAACPDPNASLLAEAADAIEQHEAFRQEVSDALEKRCFYIDDRDLGRFIIPKPDPLVDAVQDWWDADGYNDVANLRAAIEKRGGKIVWGEG